MSRVEGFQRSQGLHGSKVKELNGFMGFKGLKGFKGVQGFNGSKVYRASRAKRFQMYHRSKGREIFKISRVKGFRGFQWSQAVQGFHGNGIKRPTLTCLHSTIHRHTTLDFETVRCRKHGVTCAYGLREILIGWLAAVPTHSTIPHYPQPHHGLVARDL